MLSPKENITMLANRNYLVNQRDHDLYNLDPIVYNDPLQENVSYRVGSKSSLVSLNALAVSKPPWDNCVRVPSVI